MIPFFHGADLLPRFTAPLDGFKEQVRAITINDEARTEFELDKDIGALSGSLEDVFIAQLYCRAKTLNSTFQARVFDVVTRHAIANTHDLLEQGPRLPPDGSIHRKQEPVLFWEGGPGISTAAFNRMPSLDEIRTAQSVVTATFVLPDIAALDPPRLGSFRVRIPVPPGLDQAAVAVRTPDGLLGTDVNIFSGWDSGAGSQGPPHSPALPSQRHTDMPQRAPSIKSNSAQSSTSFGLSVPEIMCKFQGGAHPVWVSPAQAKTAARMREKIQEYMAGGSEWPRAACILDPVRASVVCEGAAQIVQVAHWFLGGQPADSGPPFLVCRVKNKFALSNSELVGGYRDLMLCCLLEGPGGLKIIGEVQIHDKVLYELKLRMHKLYRIHRAQTASSI
jgi:hypothetical protein